MIVGIWQYDISWQNPSVNFDALEKQLSEYSSEIDLLVAPEMLSTGFTMQPEELTLWSHEVLSQKLLELSQKYNTGIAASFVIQIEDKYYNRFYFVGDGAISHYDKRHLFRMAGEHEHYEPGAAQQVIVNFRGVRFLLQVCYDLRFPVFSRNVNLSYDAVIYVANWPKARVNAWHTLSMARAIENQAYCIACNRTGEDDNGIKYNGYSSFSDFLGHNEVLVNDEGMLMGQINMKQLSHYRSKFPAYKDQDYFEIK